MDTVKYVGDPFVDAGVAVLEHWLEKSCPEFTNADLEDAAERLKRKYEKKIWKGYLTIHLPNGVWCNPNPKIQPAKRQEMLEAVLAGYLRTMIVPTRPCCYCGRPSQVIADRSQAPLVTSKDSMSMGAGGRPGTPVCGYCLYAIQFYPLCTLKVTSRLGPRALFWFASEPGWTFLLASQFLRIVEKVTSGSIDKSESLKFPSTILLKSAQDVVEEWSRAAAEDRPHLCDIIGCYATNFGTEADYEELRIPKGVLQFWADAGSFGPLYGTIVSRAWEAQSSRRKRTQSKAEEWNRRNSFYEELGGAFRELDFEKRAKRIAKRFFLEPNRTASPQGLFELTAYFLEKVAGMERARLEAIRRIADQIAENVAERRIEQDLFAYNMGLSQFLNYFARLQKKLAEAGAPLNWDELLLALGISNVEDRTARDHWLVQDLILIRVYERLGKSAETADLPSLEPLATETIPDGLQDEGETT